MWLQHREMAKRDRSEVAVVEMACFSLSLLHSHTHAHQHNSNKEITAHELAEAAYEMAMK